MKSTRIAMIVLSFAAATTAWAHFLGTEGTEEFGNAPLSASNYTDWPHVADVVNDTSRVYQSWVNGNEHCYYKGDIEALNRVLQNFAKVDIKVHEVVLRPGPGHTKSFQGEPVGFDWMLHIVGGIAKSQLMVDKGALVWPKNPQLHIYVNEKTRLDQIKTPEGVTVIGLSELKGRNLEALGSTDQSVRGWGCGNLVSLDPFDRQSANAIAKMLSDREDWVRLNAAGALGAMGASAKSELPALEKTPEPKESPLGDQLKERLAKAIEEIRAAKADDAAEQSHRAMLRKIDEFLASRK